MYTNRGKLISIVPRVRATRLGAYKIALSAAESQPKTAIKHFDKAADMYEKYSGRSAGQAPQSFPRQLRTVESPKQRLTTALRRWILSLLKKRRTKKTSSAGGLQAMLPQAL